MEPDTRSATAARQPNKDGSDDARDMTPAQPAGARAAMPDGVDVTELDPLDVRIQQKEAELQAAIDSGQQGKIDRLSQRLADLKASKAERDQKRADQALLEAADALPDSGGFDDEESAEDDRPRVAHRPRADDDVAVCIAIGDMVHALNERPYPVRQQLYDRSHQDQRRQKPRQLDL